MKPLDATERRRPAGLMMDKMTPSKRTGQMHAVVIPVPGFLDDQLEGLGWDGEYVKKRVKN